MFNILQSPYAPLPTKSANLSVFVQGSSIKINGDEFDFSFMEPGDTLPNSAIDSPYFEGGVDCLENGIIQITLRVPVPPGATGDVAYPPVLEGKKYGKVIDVHIEASVVLEE